MSVVDKVVGNGTDEKCIQNFGVEKPEGKRPLGWPKCIWEGNIRMDPREIGWEGVNWIHVTHDRYHRGPLWTQ